jgi:hypothetical protein
MNALTTKEKDPCFIYRRVSSSLAVCRQLRSHHAPRFKDWSSPRPPYDPFIVEPLRPRISLFIRLMVTFSYSYSPEPIETCRQSARASKALTAQIRLLQHV